MKIVLKENIVIIIVILVGSILRFWNYDVWSLSNDELSAITRLNFDSFGKMVELGVKLDDMHPLGVQAFLWIWTSAFGLNDEMIRLPFVVLGCFSIVLVYLIAKLWFNNTSALFTASVFAMLQFPILYSQLARPYSPGLFFSLLFTLAWTKLFLFDNKNSKWKISIWHLVMIIAGSAAMYSHYFSFMLVGIVGISGLFIFDKSKFYLYFISGFIMFLFYIPNLDVFIYQFSIGGLGGPEGWLSTPSKTAIFDYIFYGLNESYIVTFICLLSALGTFFIYKNEIKISKWHVLALVFFLLPALIAYFYSIFKNPVFQYSILIFSFPYLLMLFFSFIPNRKNSLVLIFALVFIAVSTLASTIFEKKYYTTEHFGVFKDLVVKTYEYSEKYGSDNIERTVNVIKPNYINYYIKQLKLPVDYSMYSCTSPNDFINIESLARNSKKDYFLHSWSNVYHAPELESRIKKFFPFVAERDLHFNSGLVVYSKKNSFNKVYSPKVIFEESNNFEKSKWINDEKTTKRVQENDTFNYVSFVDSSIQYGSTFEAKLENIGLSKGRSLVVSFDAKSTSIPKYDDIMLVVSLEDKNGNAKVWRSLQFFPYLQSKNQWTTLYYGYTYPDDYLKDDIIKIYISNPKKLTAEFDNFIIKVYDIDP